MADFWNPDEWMYRQVEMQCSPCASRQLLLIDSYGHIFLRHGFLDPETVLWGVGAQRRSDALLGHPLDAAHQYLLRSLRDLSGRSGVSFVRNTPWSSDQASKYLASFAYPLPEKWKTLIERAQEEEVCEAYPVILGGFLRLSTPKSL